MKITLDIKRKIIAEKIQIYKNTAYDAELDARVAEALDNEPGKNQAERRIKDALKAIDLLKGFLSELEGIEQEAE